MIYVKFKLTIKPYDNLSFTTYPVLYLIIWTVSIIKIISTLIKYKPAFRSFHGILLLISKILQVPAKFDESLAS